MISRIPVPVDGRVPTGRTNAYAVGSLLVDPVGPPGALLDAIDGDVEHVAVTHTHHDHVDGVAAVADATDATVWARYGREAAFRDATGVDPDRTFRGGTAVGPATVVDTPGHARDHVNFVVGGDYVAGDLAFAEAVGSTFVGGDGADMRAYYASLRRIHARDPDALHPGHGPPIAEPRERVAAVLAHRVERERRVERAVREGARTVDAIVDAAYEKDLSGVRDAARLAVEAHLEKLAVEGRVRWDGERAAPV